MFTIINTALIKVFYTETTFKKLIIYKIQNIIV